MSAQPIDLETRAAESDHAALRLWLRLLTCTNLIEHTVRSRLRQDFASTLPRFDLHAQLERTPNGLRMSELSRQMMVTGGNITALVEQLSAEDLISRDPDPLDRRVSRVKLTATGRRRFAEMAAAHESWVEDLTRQLSRQDIEQLFDLLGKLKSSVHQASHTPTTEP